MPRIKCPKCNKVETVLKSGIIRNKQRYFCKECNYNFTLNHVDRKAKNKARKNYQTTIFDIAKALNKSPTTVSRALRDYPDISESTKRAVKDLAKKMDYRPNLLAISFASNHTKTVGVIIPHLEAPFFSSMLGGIQKAAASAGYKAIICQSDEQLKTEIENIQVLIDNRVEGLFVCHSIESVSSDHIRLFLKRGIPIIHFYRVFLETKTSKVLAKNLEGAEKITAHLIEQGYKNIAIILGPKNLLISEERLKGYLQVLDKNNIPINKGLIAYTDFKYQSVADAIDRWLLLAQKPDAIFCISDKCAVFALKHLKSKNLKVPSQIGVAGFGNDLMGELTDPSLTTFNINTFEIGTTAFNLFMAQILEEEDFKPQTITVEGELMIRESSVKKR